MRDERSVVFIEGYDAAGRPHDNLGRRQPGTLNWVNFFRTFPWLRDYFDRKVPDMALADDADDGIPVKVVACPCGEEPRAPLTRCVECACGRFYLNTGEKVLCANSPESEHRVEPAHYA